jgi:hypothetical protein
MNPDKPDLQGTFLFCCRCRGAPLATIICRIKASYNYLVKEEENAALTHHLPAELAELPFLASMSATDCRLVEAFSTSSWRVSVVPSSPPFPSVNRRNYRKASVTPMVHKHSST